METLKTTEIEKIFASNNFDTKKILNRSAKKIDKNTIDTIENIGVTSEMIKNLKIPVFHYHTQITLHGLFDSNINTYLGGYKNLICNKNLSLGVKYNAVDYDKKQRIYKHFKFHFGFNVSKNSQEYLVFKQIRVSTVTEKNEAVSKLKLILDKIPTKLFYGGANIQIVPSMFGIFVQLTINVGAIFESDINEFFIKTFGMTENESLKLIEAKELKEKNERDAANLIRIENYKIEEGIKTEILENEINRLKLVYGDYKKHELKPGMNILKIELTKNYNWVDKKIVYDGTYKVNYKVIAYSKEKGQKIYRQQSETFDNENEIKIIDTRYSSDKYSNLMSHIGFLLTSGSVN